MTAAVKFRTPGVITERTRVYVKIMFPDLVSSSGVIDQFLEREFALFESACVIQNWEEAMFIFNRKIPPKFHKYLKAIELHIKQLTYADVAEALRDNLSIDIKAVELMLECLRDGSSITSDANKMRMFLAYDPKQAANK